MTPFLGFVLDRAVEHIGQYTILGLFGRALAPLKIAHLPKRLTVVSLNKRAPAYDRR